MNCDQFDLWLLDRAPPAVVETPQTNSEQTDPVCELVCTDTDCADRGANIIECTLSECNLCD